MIQGIVRYSDGKPATMTKDVCAGKQVFATSQLARQVASRWRRQRESYDAYRCDLCGRWHIGHSKRA